MKPVPGGLYFAHANLLIAVQTLSGQVSHFYNVFVYQCEVANAATAQLLRRTTAQSANANNQHPGLLPALLTVEVNLREDNLPVIAQSLGITKGFWHS